MYLDVNEIPMREVLLKYSEIRKEEKEREGFKCCCPIHNDDTPSFKVFEESNTFYCFGCGRAGRPVDLVRMILHMGTNEEAENLLRKDYDIEEDSIPTIETMCERKGLSIKVVTEKLGWKDVEQGILMPYMGVLPEQQGEQYPTYKIRTSYTGKGERPKYIKDGKGAVIPYGLNLLESYNTAEPLYIAEGETDMATLLQAGLQVIGIPGANSFKDEFVKYLLPYSILIVVLDSDAAADNLLHAIIGKMEQDARKVFFMPMPHGVKDINTLHCTTCKKNVKVFKEKIQELLPIPATIGGFEILKRTMPRG